MHEPLLVLTHQTYGYDIIPSSTNVVIEAAFTNIQKAEAYLDKLDKKLREEPGTETSVMTGPIGRVLYYKSQTRGGGCYCIAPGIGVDPEEP